MELEPEHLWLCFRLKRLRMILRRTKEPAVERLLRELIADAEDRLELLEQLQAQRERTQAREKN